MEVDLLRLSQLTQGIPLEDHIRRDVDLTSLTCDTRTLAPGGLFAAFAGAREDGSRYIPQALARGAAAVLCARPPAGEGPWLVSPNPRAAFGQMAANWFGRPGEKLTLVGVTGTNGKTTTTYLLKTVLEQVLGAKVGLIGTNQNLIGDLALPAQRTTPDAYSLQALLARMAAAGCAYGVMEVSSHALALERTAGLTFQVGIFTNLTRDHLDFHGTMGAYRQAKARLFAQCRRAVLNQDDPTGRRFARQVPCPAVTVGIHPTPAQVQARDLRLYPDRVAFQVTAPQGSCPVTLSIPGRFSVSNALGVIACALELGLPLEGVAQALGSAAGVKGRMEVVPVPAPYTVLIDYAHTPDALEQALTAARSGARCRLLCLFGCGGDRDRTKRPVMGEVAAALADVVILTSDNPRTEDPEAILDQVAAGFPRDFTAWVREVDRRKAIRQALAMGRAGDVILLAGKGHETYQDIGGERRHLDEREEIASFFRENTV